MIVTTIILALSIGLIPVAGTTGTRILLFVSGLIRTGVFSLANTLLFETKGVGATYGGTAIGLTNSLGMLGAFAAAPIGNSFSSINNNMPLVFWAVLAAIALPLLFLLKESKSKLEIIPG